MPYRRLPKTDLARLASLQKAAELDQREMAKIPVSFKLINEAKAKLPLFKNLVQQYNLTFSSQVEENRKYQAYVRSTRMYTSHFIQVLNFTVMRGEMRKENKLYYKLDMDDPTVPDLSTEHALLVWGHNVIKGEEERISKGGVALQNPHISKLKMNYAIFKECKYNQSIRKENTARNLQNVTAMRDEIDALIKEIWDAIEAKYAELLPYERYVECKNCGVIYYYRKGEKKLTPKVDNDIRANRKATQYLDFNENNLDD